MDHKIGVYDNKYELNKQYFIEVKEDNEQIKLISCLGVLNIIALILETVVALYVLVVFSPFAIYHIFALVFGILYQIYPSLSTNFIYKALAQIFSSLYIMLFIFNTYLYFNAISSSDRDIALLLLLFLTIPTALSSLTLLLVLNSESVSQKNHIRQKIYNPSKLIYD